MALVEVLVERNILRWRDGRIRRRENRPSMQAGWVPPSKPTPEPGQDGDDEDGEEEDDEEDGTRGQRPESPKQPPATTSGGRSILSGYLPGSSDSASISSKASGNTTSRIFGFSRRFDNTKPATAPAPPTENPPPAAVTAYQVDEAGVLSGDGGWDAPVVDDQWAGAVSTAGQNQISTAELDATEQLALFAREGAELVWSNNLVRTVCEAFVNGSQLQW
ncbi:hypothetical protein HK405_012703 [Cladochytrium tenue]|nr:hypothetical protein HK405_012703 [Cladochytrium tenue]